jgi:hypothetical protein
MLNIWEENKLILFITFVVPGFIAIKAYELLSPSRYTDSSKQIVDAVSYSCIVYIILLWPIYLVEKSTIRSTQPHLYLLFYTGAMFVFPLILVIGWKYLRQLEIIQKFVPHPTQKPWDFVFGQRNTYWVIVTLKNGEKIGGMFGLNSFASSAPAKEQIYLEEHWVLNEDGGFDRRAEQSSGIIILSSEILSVELIHSGEYENEPKKSK